MRSVVVRLRQQIGLGSRSMTTARCGGGRRDTASTRRMCRASIRLLPGVRARFRLCDAAGAFFHVVSTRYETPPTIVTHQPRAAQMSVDIGGLVIAVAILDRLTHNVVVSNAKLSPCRLREHHRLTATATHRNRRRAHPEEGDASRCTRYEPSLAYLASPKIVNVLQVGANDSRHRYAFRTERRRGCAGRAYAATHRRHSARQSCPPQGRREAA